MPEVPQAHFTPGRPAAKLLHAIDRKWGEEEGKGGPGRQCKPREQPLWGPLTVCGAPPTPSQSAGSITPPMEP